MKLKHKYLKNVAVYCKGKFYNFVDGEIEVSEAEGIELLKNINICEVEEEVSETAKNSGKKGNR